MNVLVSEPGLHLPGGPGPTPLSPLLLFLSPGVKEEGSSSLFLKEVGLTYPMPWRRG